MNFDGYQRRAMSHAFYPNRKKNLTYPVLGLAGETGEVAEKVKKCIRDSDGVVSPELRLSLLREAGDVLWYLAALAEELGSSLDEVAEIGIEKLEGRAKRGTLGGSGDDR